MEASTLNDDDSVAADGAHEIFGFHKARRMVGVVHALEAQYRINRDDRAARLAVTVADQAIQGHGSIRFTEEECRVDGLVVDPLSLGICKFHEVDWVGHCVASQFEECEIFDRLQRLLRRHFAFGTGKLILRSCAQKFKFMANKFEAQASLYHDRVARLKANCQLIAAERVGVNASQADAEAMALRRSGRTKAHTPAAPRADGTRKVVWQSLPGGVFFYIRVTLLGYSGSYDTDLGRCQTAGHKGRQAGYGEHWVANAGDAVLAEFGSSNVRHSNLGIQSRARRFSSATLDRLRHGGTSLLDSLICGFGI